MRLRWFLWAFMFLFTLQGAFSLPSTDPGQYYFYDDMSGGGALSVSYTNVSGASYSSGNPYPGGSRSINVSSGSTTPRNTISPTNFTTSEYSSPYCLSYMQYDTVSPPGNNQEAGVMFNLWANALVNRNSMDSEINMTWVGDSAGWNSLSTYWGNQTWVNLTVCFIEGYAASGNTTGIFLKNGVEVGNITTIDRYSLAQINLHNRLGSPAHFGLIRIWNYTLYGVDGPQVGFTAELYNNVTNTKIGELTFLNVTGNLSLTYFNITSDGFCLEYTGNGTGTNCTAVGSGASTFFNTTVNVSIPTNQTIRASTYQALLNISVYQLFTNNTIQSFNATNDQATNQTTTSSLLLAALNGSNNIQIDVGGNYSKNVTCSVPNPLETVSCNATGVYDNLFTIGANRGGVGLSNFTVNVTNTTLGGSLDVKTTTNGSLIFPLIQGYEYFFFIDPQNHTFANATLPANATTNLYNFSVYYAQTLNFTLRDEITRTILNTSFEIEIISDTTATNYTITTGQFNISLLSPNDYTIRYRSTDYPERDYYLNITPQSYNEIILYAISFNESNDVLVTVKDNEGNAVEGAVVILLRYYAYCNCYEPVEMSTTGFTGIAYLNGQYYEGHYKWAVEYQGVNYFLSTSPENLVPGQGETIVTRTITINLGEDPYESFTAITSTGYACTYNSTSGGLSLTWSGTSVTQACLDVTFVNGTQWQSVGESCLTTSAGSIVQNLNTSLTYKYEGTLTIEGNDVVVCASWIDAPVDYNFAGVGQFLSAGILMTLVLAFSYSATGVLVITGVGIIIINLLGTMTFTTSFITGLAALIFGLGVYILRS